MESKIQIENNKIYIQNQNKFYSNGTYIDLNDISTDLLKELKDYLNLIIERRENE